MTTQEKLESMLIDRGLFKHQAHEIIEGIKPKVQAVASDYRITWDRPADEYPDQMYTILYRFYARPAALEWIEANLPQAWFKPPFQESA